VPRGLYGRAALILVVPIVTIQLVVSIMFIQRHYEAVTRQMTESIVLEIGYLLQGGGG
jgi:two-component system, OmpR family, osmolarity sensor histidine kinase EnvZ